MTCSRVGVFSRGVHRLRDLRTFLGAEQIVFNPSPRDARALDAIAGWGHKHTATRARDWARAHNLPYLALEDGFLRSVGLGPREPPLSLVVDDAGIYYDARQPSHLENLLAHDGPDDPLADPALLARARSCRERIVSAEISKYNHFPARLPPELDHDARPLVIVVDQTENDASIEQGLASRETFGKMLAAAQREHPNARIAVKVHPEVAARRKRGHFDALASSTNTFVLGQTLNPLALLKRAHHVYVATSLLGFEALLTGVPVSCFGAPFYAGWGLTRDDVRVPRRRRTRTLDELVAAALLLYPRYVHPITRTRCDAEVVIEHLALQREMFKKNARSFVCVGFSRWKRPFIRRYLASPDGHVEFVSSVKRAARRTRERDATLVVWGSKSAPPPDAPKPWCIEDGFLRSVRLGSELTPPGSLVVDTRGIYYDPRTPSDLEHLLQHEEFTAAELERAAALRTKIVDSGVSKYNPRANGAQLKHQARPGQRIVLVPGQVEDDASVLLGSPTVRTNLELLREVRRARPEAYIVYKAHPDVVIGNRRGAVTNDEHLWDELVEEAPLAACLSIADEVHTMTSLVGFEALLREIPVVVWGMPFYAGWGLTTDMERIERRTRHRTIDELVAGVLLRYPRYYSFQARAFCTPETFIDELLTQRQRRRWIDGSPWIVRRLHALATSAQMSMEELCRRTSLLSAQSVIKSTGKRAQMFQRPGRVS